MPELPVPSSESPAFDRFMSLYGAAFDAYDLETIMEYYNTPCFIYKDGSAIFLPDASHKRDYFQDLLRRLRAAEVHHSDMPSLAVTMLGASSAVVTVRWVSKKEDGSVVWDFFDSYYLARFGEEWKFLGDSVHEGEYSKSTSRSLQP
jgi:hypothetical protein